MAILRSLYFIFFLFWRNTERFKIGRWYCTWGTLSQTLSLLKEFWLFSWLQHIQPDNELSAVPETHHVLCYFLAHEGIPPSQKWLSVPTAGQAEHEYMSFVPMGCQSIYQIALELSMVHLSHFSEFLEDRSKASCFWNPVGYIWNGLS